MMSDAPVAPVTFETLAAQIKGVVLLPGSEAYEQARQGFNLSYQQFPALIVMAESADDVIAAVKFARSAGMLISVQSTGHGLIREADGNLLIVTSRMNAVEIDTEAQTAYAGAGAIWAQVLEPAQAVGLAPLLGSSPTVGVVGYSLGGGYGWLGRKFGMATDSILEIEMVNAQGELIRINANENADLFWGMRGGSGAFGVVTALRFRLYPVTTVFGGNLLYPAELAQEAFRFFREWSANAPDALTSSIAIMNFPPVPDVPEPMRGKSFVIVRALYAGSLEEGAALVGQWTAWNAPIINAMRPMPFSEVASVSADPTHPMPAMTSGAWMANLDDAAINTITRYTLPAGGPPALVFAEVRHFGGVIARVPADSNAFSHRDAAYVLSVVGVTPTPEAGQGVAAHIAELKAALAAHLTGGVYMNFLEGHESRQRTHQAFSEGKFERLQALKQKHDADNLFRSGFDLKV